MGARPLNMYLTKRHSNVFRSGARRSTVSFIRHTIIWSITLGFTLYLAANLYDSSSLISTEKSSNSAHDGNDLKVGNYAYVKSKVTIEKETKVFRWKNDKFEMVPGFCSEKKIFNSANLKTGYGDVKMYIHEVFNDVHVSWSIKNSGMWDAGGVETMVRILKQDPDMGVVDLGAQLGTYSLVAAKMGRQVVAVEPLVENVLRMCRTVQEGNLTDRVAILFTALSDSRSIVGFQRYRSNNGGTRIQSVTGVTLKDTDDYNAHLVKSVHLDDILQAVNFSKAFMKIDVEGHEYKALRKGRSFFSTIDVQVVLMEWFKMRTMPSAQKLVRFLRSQKFHAVDTGTGHPLLADYRRWPNDILWVKM